MRSWILIVFLLAFNPLLGQTAVDENRIFWSETRKLAVNDFGIKTQEGESNSSFAQFSMDYEIRGFDFMAKSFNKKVRNYFIKSASWIDTTNNVSVSLRYLQTVFDLSEIYTRQFRKLLKKNRMKIGYGMKIIEELNDKIVTDLSNRRLGYERDTKSGTLLDKQAEWELQIQKELRELKEFAYE